MRLTEQQRKAILQVMRTAAHNGGKLPIMKVQAEKMGMTYDRFKNNLLYMKRHGVLASDELNVYYVDGMRVQFGDRRRKKPPAEPKYVKFKRACMCCGATFESLRSVRCDNGLTAYRTVYRLCYDCRTDRQRRVPTGYEMGDQDAA